jgi:hypothetical protein
MQRQKNDTIQSRVYSYGCVPARVTPVQGEEKAIDQLRLANLMECTGGHREGTHGPVSRHHAR